MWSPTSGPFCVRFSISASIFSFTSLSRSILGASAEVLIDDRGDSGLGKDFCITASYGSKVICEFIFSFTAADIINWFGQVWISHRGSLEADAQYSGTNRSVLIS